MTSHEIAGPLVIYKDAPRGLQTPVEEVLVDFGLMAAFRARPSPEQEDYIEWIDTPEQPEMRDERIAQMLDELHLDEASKVFGEHVDFSIPRSTYRQED